MQSNFQHQRMQSTLQTLPRRRRCLAKRGFAAIELVLTLPILGIILMGIVEFSMLFYARSSVAQACRSGARAASQAGVQPDQVEWEVRNVLPPSMQDGVQVDVAGGELSGEVVAVSVSVPMNAACPDLLWPIGYSLEGRYLVSETRMIKE